MSDRGSGRDASGRPIVAELGRAETPDERADRTQAARATRRANQTTFNLVVAIVASLVIPVLIVVLVMRPDQQTSLVKTVDWKAVAAQAQASTTAHLLVPALPSGWVSNRATWDASPADRVPHWSVGWVTPDGQYAALDQGVGGADDWAIAILQQKGATGTTSLAGRTWTVYDHRGDQNPGNLAYALEITLGDSRVVLSGTATDAEFRTLAAAVVADSAGGTS